MSAPHTCRFCNADLTHVFLDLGVSPLANDYLSAADLLREEVHYPLCVYVCGDCYLVQLPAFETPERIFGGEYLYFSSYSDAWLAHCKGYASIAKERFGLGDDSLVVEVASNDGYLLQYFKALGIPVLGVEPAANVAAVATERGIPTRTRFFGTILARELAEEGHTADLLVANNVLAHVPNVRDFAAGIANLLAPRGVATIEFPHLMQLVEKRQFDTIYHEHFSYFSFGAVQRIFEALSLTVFDVERLPTHGGSLRVYACRKDSKQPVSDSVEALVTEEREKGYFDLELYGAFAREAEQVRRDVLRFLVSAADEGKRVVGYGAPAKGNTLLNYCGVRSDLLPFTVDRSPHKQGRFLPGSRIPVRTPEDLIKERPDYVWILPWNLRDEISAQLAEVPRWGGQFVTTVPRLEVFS